MKVLAANWLYETWISCLNFLKVKQHETLLKDHPENWTITQQNLFSSIQGNKSSMYISVKIHSKRFNAKRLLVELDVTRGELGDCINIFQVQLNKNTFYTAAEMIFEKLSQNGILQSSSFYFSTCPIKKTSFCNHIAEAQRPLFGSTTAGVSKLWPAAESGPLSHFTWPVETFCQ